MNPDELPLLDLFNRLRDHGLPLGITEYTSVLRAIRAGFGIESRQALAQLCCTVWTKSDEEVRLFHRLFDQMLAQHLARPSEPEHPGSLPPVDEVPADETPLLTSTAKPPQIMPSPATPTPLPTIPMNLEDEPVQVVQAVRRRVSDNWLLSRPRFSQLTDYFPVTYRQMKQSWRYLRRLVREGPPVELDVKATVERIGREGILLEPVLVPRRSSRAELVLMIDQDGSMVPFHILSRQLVETAWRGGKLSQIGVYYFHDYLDAYFYLDPTRLTAQSVSDVLATMDERTVVLIVSDAGAARGYLDSERVERIQSFLQQLKQSVRYYAWLNPMPNHRWSDSTAGQIARLVPMFEMSRSGLDAAISALRGRYVYWEKMYPWMI
jgi:uncharacterized protein